MRRALALALILVALGTASNQALSRNDVLGKIGTEFTWSGSAPAWGGDHTLVNKSDFTAKVSNNGNCAPGQPSTYIMVFSDMQACATNATAVAHTPILANNTFSGGSFSSWTADTVGGTCTTGTNFAALTGTDEDADNGYAKASSSCFTNGSTFGTFGLTQTFSVGGTPTSQSYSFWYQAPYVHSGDVINCDAGSGTTTNLILKINGATVRTVSSLTQGTNWQNVTGSTTALVSGSNTIDVSVQLSGSKGSSLVLVGGRSICSPNDLAQPFYLDNLALTATY